MGCFTQVFVHVHCLFTSLVIRETIVAMSRNSKISSWSFSPKTLECCFHGRSPQMFSHVSSTLIMCMTTFDKRYLLQLIVLKIKSCKWANFSWHNYTLKGIPIMLVIPWFLGNKLGINNFNIIKKGEFLFSGYGVLLKV